MASTAGEGDLNNIAPALPLSPFPDSYSYDDEDGPDVDDPPPPPRDFSVEPIPLSTIIKEDLPGVNTIYDIFTYYDDKFSLASPAPRHGKGKHSLTKQDLKHLDKDRKQQRCLQGGWDKSQLPRGDGRAATLLPSSPDSRNQQKNKQDGRASSTSWTPSRRITRSPSSRSLTPRRRKQQDATGGHKSVPPGRPTESSGGDSKSWKPSVPTWKVCPCSRRQKGDNLS